MSRFLDWLELNDYGYPLGLAAYTGGCIALICEAWLVAAPLIILGFVLCWWLG